MSSNILKKSENIQRACSSIMENFLPIFLPFNQIRKNNPIYKEFTKNDNRLEIKSAYGIVELRNRLLTQQHKDILEAILKYKKIFIKNERAMVVEIDSRYDILKTMGISTTNYKYLEEKLKELEDFSISILSQNDEKKESTQFGIISVIKIVEDKVKKRMNIKIKFTAEFTAFYMDSNLLDYKNNIEKIAKLPSPFLKAVVRYMLIHKQHQINIDNFIKTMGFDKLLDKPALSRKKKELETHRELLREFDIEIVDSLTYKSKTVKIKQDDDNKQSIALIQNKNKKQMHFSF